MLTPRKFQQVAIDKAIAQPGFLVADECGLGKTLVGIEAVKAIRRERKDFKSLVVCPPSIVRQWTEAIADQDPFEPVCEVAYTPYDFTKLRGWFVSSYFELHNKLIQTQLCEVVWDVVIADEAHRIRNRTTKSAKTIKRLFYAHAIALTATPMEHGAQELWSILNFIRPDVFPTYWSYIIENFVVEEGEYTKWDIKGLKDPIAFGGRIGEYMIQRSKEEVAPELPEKIIIPTNVAMTPKQELMYKQIKSSDDLIVEVDDQELLIKNVLTHLLRLQQISTMPSILGLNADSGKLLWLNDFLKDHPDDPIVVFSRFRPVVDYMTDIYGAAFVGGGCNDVSLFANGVTNMAACVIADSLQGVDGLQRAKHAVFLDTHLSATQMTQAIERVHRMNIKDPKNIYLLTSSHEDRMVMRAVDEKWTEQELVYYFLKNRG